MNGTVTVHWWALALTFFLACWFSAFLAGWLERRRK